MLFHESIRDIVLPFLVVHAVIDDVPFGPGAVNDEPR